MFTMTLNNKATEPIDISSYSRILDVANPDIRFELDFNFEGNYSADGIEYLADYANDTITDIEIVNQEDNTVLLNAENIRGKLRSLYENCNKDGRTGYGVIALYEATANI